MRVKKYTVNSLPEALKQIKQDLGEDAVIVNTKKLKTRGFLGLFKKQHIEVVAAADRGRQAPEMLKNAVSPAEHRQEASTSSASYQELRGEIQHLTKSIMTMLTEKEDKLPSSVQKVHRFFTTQGLGEEVRSHLLTKLLHRMDAHPDSLPEETVFAWAYEELLAYIQQLPIHSPDTVPEMICFVGPTGVGKTTTMAKLAADFTLNRHLKVGFITADTYRIAAVEQLKSYATILNIPLEVVYSADELQTAYKNLSACDMILIDTAGRNYLDKQYIKELKTLLPQDRDLQTHLVLSVTAKYEDLQKIVGNFEAVHIDRLTLTKIDETTSCGAVVNILHDFSIPLTYVTTGQDVPDDLVSVTPEFIAQLIWRDQVHERSG